MYLFAAAHLPLEADIEIEFRPPDAKQSVCVRGTVRRRALYLYGIEFVGDDAVAAAGVMTNDTDTKMPPPSEA